MHGTQIAAPPTAKEMVTLRIISPLPRLESTDDGFCTSARCGVRIWSLQAPRELVASEPVEQDECAWIRVHAGRLGGYPWINHQSSPAEFVWLIASGRGTI
ncbi:hypothetical protein JDV02_006644 [Purpureocillium takamizusanense]|uniref:Uncharacterized protein n=1 Tax=Purpureocillium takamizusanense TaxID=2060973 RepID=A0A9Q8VD58_9HYPO|nr:uncharacterized protein JDV02_006644 [Purpureocillium takamizusanense]UNI20569.1 hypothetical protein JDV02_006644 [Purpureocillium takamizusanense]